MVLGNNYLAKELVPRKIRVNPVNPGMVETEGLHATALLRGVRTLEAIARLGRIDQPDDIAPTAVFFASQDSSWITGETLYITGGLR